MTCGGSSYRSISAARARPQQQTRRPPLLLSIDGTDRRRDRQTDRRTLDHFIVLTAYNADRVLSVITELPVKPNGDCECIRKAAVWETKLTAECGRMIPSLFENIQRWFYFSFGLTLVGTSIGCSIIRPITNNCPSVHLSAPAWSDRTHNAELQLVCRTHLSGSRADSIHTARHDTDSTVLCRLAGGVNWA